MSIDPRNYPLEFKIESVRRYLENGKRGKFTARELDIPVSTLRGWKRKYMDEVKDQIKTSNKKQDIESLLKEKDALIQRLIEENNILKKSIGIFTRGPLQK